MRAATAVCLLLPSGFVGACWDSHADDGEAGADAALDDADPDACTPDCTGLECGPDPVCGLSCGRCRPGWECTAVGSCQDRCREEYCEQVFIPAGPFVMGSDDDTDIVLPAWIAWRPNLLVGEMPEHIVHLSAYWIDRYEVTVERYMSCVAAGACRAPRYARVTDPAYVDHPISAVFTDAVAYCAWIGRRLPTEAEWEKAARGGCEMGGDPLRCDDPEDERQWPWGNELPDCSRGNINVGDSADMRQCTADGSDDTMPVGSYSAGRSPYGADDMMGNIREWVSDWRGDYEDFGCAVTCADPTGPATGTSHVLRGCDLWCTQTVESNVVASRVSGRWPVHFYPEEEPSDWSGEGFRCASDAE